MRQLCLIFTGDYAKYIFFVYRRTEIADHIIKGVVKELIFATFFILSAICYRKEMNQLKFSGNTVTFINEVAKMAQFAKTYDELYCLVDSLVNDYARENGISDEDEIANIENAIYQEAKR